MKDEQLHQESAGFDHREIFFRLINPEEYYSLGIDNQDVPIGTFAAEDHPSFLPSRYGGNAYGLGLVEQSVLSRADTDFLEKVDLRDPNALGRHAKRLNAIYQKLGLLIRFSHSGKRYFLIPINLVAHSLQEIKNKADEIEELIIRHIWETRTERLDIGLLTGSHDLIVHELTARLSTHRIFLFESIEKLRSWRIPLDIVIIPKDPFEYLLGQKLPKMSKWPVRRQRLMQYAMYIAGKIHDLLEANGELLLLAHSPGPQEDQLLNVRFKSEEDFKTFLLFLHIFKTKGQYECANYGREMAVFASDLHYYLNRFAFFDPHLKRLLDHQKPEELAIEEINRLPYLNLRMSQSYIANPQKHWKSVFGPYFTLKELKEKSPKHQHQYWRERLETSGDLPESLIVFAAQPRSPAVTLAALDEEIKTSGLEGCSLSLIADYRNSFRYVLDVLRILIDIRDNRFPKLSELERTRLTNPFRTRSQNIAAIVRLLGQITKLEKVRDILNPDFIEGHVTSILENIPKLSLFGFSPAQLREILLIVVGHTTMGRVVFGKLPARSLKPLTDRAKEGNYQEILDVLRVCRLTSLAEIAAALGDSFTTEQARELYRVYDDAIHVATDPDLDWEKLHDLRISALGGVQNKAIREMLKFFNLFEFLDNWQESVSKGAFQKEVICDYEPEKLGHLEEGTELVRIASQFKQQFMGDYLFGQTYFFRQLLDTEFHGTGHLLPKLGPRAGFILLWITVNSSDRHAVNFNPVLAGIPHGRRGDRIAKIKATLLRIPIEMLEPWFFEEIKKSLFQGRPAFVFDSGVRMVRNPESRAIDVSFVDVDENIRQLEGLLTHFESQKLRDVSLKNLQEMEKFFSELESLHNYLHEEGCYIQCDLFDQRDGLGLKDKEIGEIEIRLKRILQTQIFVPEEVYDSISVLAKHCPEMLRFILPEFHALGNLVETWPTRKKQSLGIYLMKCVEKFQALVIKDRSNFQDQNALYQLAKQEFGPLAEEGIGATHAQMDILEYLVDRIQQRPSLYQALTIALIFQDIGKIDEYANSYSEASPSPIHAERSAVILERSGILKRYHLEEQTEETVILLVRNHGLIGHVLQGEEPVTSLECLTAAKDDRLLDVFVLHAVLAASAIREGLMISDLLDRFFAFRAHGLHIVKSKGTWDQWLRDTLREEGEAVLADVQLGPHQAMVLTPEESRHCAIPEGDEGDDALLQGRRCAALERLLKLIGATWVDYLDLQMHRLEIPVQFIYHKKKLKSVGPVTFEKQLLLAVKLLDVISSLSPEVRCYLLYCLDHLGASMRIYGFDPLAEILEPADCLKLLLAAFRTYHQHFGLQAKGGLISFGDLSRSIERRNELLHDVLKEFPLPERCLDANVRPGGSAGFGRLEFEVIVDQKSLAVAYRDSPELDEMVESIRDLWDPDELRERYNILISELQKVAHYDTRHFEEELLKIFEEQQAKITEQILRTLQNRLSEAAGFDELAEIQGEIRASLSRVGFSEEQSALLREMFEFHRSRLRDRYLDSVYRQINGLESAKTLVNHWNSLKHELFSYRPYIGKEYELLISEFVDKKLKEM